MKIDFHCHTKATKKGEALTRNVTNDFFKEKIEEMDVKILCITNHNHFDLAQYTELRDNVIDHCDVWPGIEVDVLGKHGKDGHVLVICDPNKAHEFSEILVDLIDGSNPDNFKITIDHLVKSMENLDVIYIAHFLKNKEMSIDDINYLESIVSNRKRVFKEPGDLTSIGVLNCHGHRAIIGSDVKDWNDYHKCHLGELKLPVHGYENFLKLVDKDIALIKDSINEQFVEEMVVYGNVAKEENPFKIPIYKDVNIIFGDKGSGKSEILKSLKKCYDLRGDKYIYYEGGDKDKWFKELLEIKNEDYNLNELFENTPSNHIQAISEFVDAEPNTLKSYRNYYSDQITNNNQKRMKITQVEKRHLFNETEYSALSAEHRKLVKFSTELSSYKVSIQHNDLYLAANKALDELIKKSNEMVISEWNKQYTEYLFDDFVERIAVYISENTGKATKPVETGFGNFAKKRMTLYKNAQEIITYLENSRKIDPIYIGAIGAKGDGYIDETIMLLNKNNGKDIDKDMMINKQITTMKKIVVLLDEISSSVYSKEVGAKVQEFKNICIEKEIADLSAFIAVKKKFTLNGNEYSPSKGEKAILALQYELLSKREKDVFIIDEPELSLGSIYIESDIVPLINRLSSAKKTVIIATHDGNIAIRTRPLNSIFKVTTNNVYKTYIGNLFTNELVNITDPNDILSWKEQSVIYLEGGTEAFEERGYLYE